jgi:preprotein translocase subunit SecG
LLLLLLLLLLLQQSSETLVLVLGGDLRWLRRARDRACGKKRRVQSTTLTFAHLYIILLLLLLLFRMTRCAAGAC